MDRVVVPQLWNHSLEVVQLSANGVHQHQGRASASGVVAQPRTIGPDEKPDLASAVAPRRRVRRVWKVIVLHFCPFKHFLGVVAGCSADVPEPAHRGS
jgi:hypothetical protein